MVHRGFLAVVTIAGIAGTAWLANTNSDLSASEEPLGSFREAFSDSETPDPVEGPDGVRLNYFDSTWDKVLRDVAEQSELTLVMDKAPHGRFARRDRKRYQTESAIRILNTELEQQGVRLVQQGPYLIVLKLDQARSRYARPVLTPPVRNDWQPASDVAQQQPRSTLFGGQQKQPNPFSTVAARNANSTAPASWASQQENADAGQDEPFGAFVKPPATQKTNTATSADNGPMQLQTISILNAKAAEVARSIYLVFETRSELVREGLQGLPTFVVNDQPAGAESGVSTPLFRIGIDQKNNKLLVEASAVRGQHLSKLVKELDKPKIAENETVKLVPNKGVNEKTAKNLNQQIHRMVAMQQAQTDTQSPPALAGNASQSEEGTLNLRGEVNVQAMQDLGILILKGNEADVEKVSKIIDQLEQMSIGSLPGIHILALQHVNSEAMAELMTTVYEQLAEVRARGGNTDKEAAFLPVVKPNSLLIIAPEIDMESIRELANELDKKTDPLAEFEVFSLRNAIASQVSDGITNFYQERGGLGTRVRVIADARTNAVIVQGRTNDLEEIAKLVEKLDKDSSGSTHRVEIIQLRHATAEELSTTINTAIQSAVSAAPQPTTGGGGFGGGGGQVNQDLQETKSVALEFLTTTSGGRDLLRSGILSDVRINSDARSNSLMISAPEASIPLLLALVERLDQPPTAVSEIKVFALKNADAEQSVELLTTMFENQNQEDQLGIVIAGAEDAASSLVPVVFSADLRTNTVLAVGSPETLSVVEAVLLRLDTTDSRRMITNVLTMRNVQASNVADALDDFLQQQQDLRDSGEGLVSNIERLRQEVTITAEDNSNSLIVSASPEYYSQIEQIVQNLDATPPQVIIQALIVEVQLDNTDEFGVELGFQDPLLFARSLIDTIQTVTTSGVDPVTGFTTNTQTVVSANANPGFGFNNTLSPLGNNAAGAISGSGGATRPGTIASQGISNFSLGRQNGDLGFGGFVFSAQSDAVSVLVRALAARRTVHVLSRPQIRTTSNQEASIQVGQRVPVVTGVTITNNISQPNVDQENVGIILQVTPRVTAEGTVYMSVFAEKSALSGGGVPIFVDANSGNVVESPIIDTATANTVVAVPNGQTIVIGGMITKTDETLERKVPWLGDLPIVGKAFRYDGTNTARSELLIFLTPRVIYSDIDAEAIKQIESERLHFIESEAEEMHGPIFSVPPSQMDAYSTDLMEQPYYGEPIGEPVIDDSNQMQDGPAIVLPPQAGSQQRKSAVRTVAREEFDITDGPTIQPASGTRAKSGFVNPAVGTGTKSPKAKQDEKKSTWRNRFMDKKN